MQFQIRTNLARFAVCIALCSWLGCGGGDDDDTQAASKGDKSAGKAGSTSIGQIKDTGDPSAPVECGTRMCEASKDGAGCCLDKKTSFCGILGSNTQCAAVADPRCPSVNGALGEMASCCTVDGECGIDQAWTGAGCVSLASMTFRQFTPNAPEARPCDGADAGAK